MERLFYFFRPRPYNFTYGFFPVVRVRMNKRKKKIKKSRDTWNQNGIFETLTLIKIKAATVVVTRSRHARTHARKHTLRTRTSMAPFAVCASVSVVKMIYAEEILYGTAGCA